MADATIGSLLQEGQLASQRQFDWGEQGRSSAERFVNLNTIALGVLQILAPEFPQAIWQGFPR
jgi:hypothetical protein